MRRSKIWAVTISIVEGWAEEGVMTKTFFFKNRAALIVVIKDTLGFVEVHPEEGLNATEFTMNKYTATITEVRLFQDAKSELRQLAILDFYRYFLDDLGEGNGNLNLF